MKSFAVKEKRTASATRKAHQYIHQPMTTVQRSNQAIVQEILQSTTNANTTQNTQENKDNNAVLPIVFNKQAPNKATPNGPLPDKQVSSSFESSKDTKQKNDETKTKIKGIDKANKSEKSNKNVVQEDGSNYPKSPEGDPAFKKLKNRVNYTAKGQKKTDKTAKEESQAAQSSAKIADNEVKGKAQENQVNEMSDKKPGEFNAEAFKIRLMNRIEGMRLPKNQDEAANFEDNNNIQEISNATATDTSKEREKTAAPIASATKAEPDISDKAVEKRVVTPLRKAPIGRAPKSIHANSAMPGTRPENQVSQPLQNNMQEVDQQMIDNDVTDHQLTKANEPTFSGALGERDKARTNTEMAPAQFRQQETTALTETAQGAKTKGSADIGNMHQSRDGLLNAMVEQQVQTGTKDSAERERISTTINGFYQTTKTDVEVILANLDSEVTTMFNSAALEAKQEFEDYVKKEVAAYKSRRYSGLRGLYRWGRDKFKGLPDAVNKYFVTGRELYIARMDTALTNISVLISNKLTDATKRIALGKKNVDEFVGKLKGNLAKFGQEAAESIQTKFDQLSDSVNSKQDDLIDSLAQKYNDSLLEVDTRIDEMKAANRGIIDKALDAINSVIDTIKKLKQLISDLLSAIKSVLPTIMKDPIGFASNLFSGVKQGFNNFKENIKEHLLSGFIKWLTGAMGPVNISIPDNLFSPKGIFSLVGQVLGLTWDYVRIKAVKLIGAPAVKAMETSFALFQTIRQIILTDGIVGVWQYIKDQFTDLKEVVIDAIQNMLITKVIEAGIKWLLRLLIPGAGFIKAVMAIKDFIVFFVESALMLIPTLIKAIKAMASGAVSGVATAVEKGLGLLIPAVISLFAKIIGLGGLVERVQKIIKKLRKRIDRAVNKLIKKIQKSFRKVFSKGLGGVKSLGKSAIKNVKKWWRMGKEVVVGNRKHKIYFKGKPPTSKFVVSSSPAVNYTTYLDKIEKHQITDAQKKAHSGGKKIGGSLDKHIKNRTMDKAESDKLVVDLNKFSALMKKMGTETSVPASIIKYGPLTAEQGGTKAEATILSKNSGGSRGTTPRDNPPIWTAVKHRKSDENKRAYVQGHLLNHNVHGPGKRFNMTPITYKANSEHKVGIEKEIKSLVNDKNNPTVVYYKVTVEYKGHPDSPDFKALKAIPINQRTKKQIKQLAMMKADRKLATQFSFIARTLVFKNNIYVKGKSISYSPVKNEIPKKKPKKV